MALNKYMHPRNPYRESKPNFKQLAEKYEDFREHTTVDERGHYHIDFKKPECLKALSWVLLKENFDLDVLMPIDRLIPTIPLRLNYILWLEDILNQQTDAISGIDIGTGASCIYPLLGAKKNSWSFLATETDATNYNYAKKNVEKNQLTDKIKVEQVVESWTLYDVLSTNEEVYDFCMCNPPFFGSNFEAWGMLTSRSDDRPEPSSINTASPVECIVSGGEVEFTKRMITDSLVAKGRVRVYTTMLGKKSSISVVKEELRRNGVTNIGQTEFCQGKTMRWGIGWSFDDSVKFPKPPSKTMRAEKPRPPMVYHIPQPLKDAEYSLEGATKKILKILDDLEIAVSVTKNTKKARNFILEATKNTWSNQRRKRRQYKSQPQPDSSDAEQKLETNGVNKIDISSQIQGTKDLKPKQEKDILEKDEPDPENHTINFDEESVTEEKNGTSASKKLRIDVAQSEISDKSGSPNKNNLKLSTSNQEMHFSQISNLTDSDKLVCPQTDSNSADDNKNQGKVDETVKVIDPTPVSMLSLFKGNLSINLKAADDIVLEMQFLSGENRESIHQVLQYIKNKLQ